MDPVSLATGITGLITLSTAVVTEGCKYLKSVSAAPKEFRDLVRETASLSAVLSQIVPQSLTEGTADGYRGVRVELLKDCEDTLRNVQSVVDECASVGQTGANALLWPRRKTKIVKNREPLSRLCATLHAAVSLEGVVTLRMLEREQRYSSEFIKTLTQHVDETQSQKILDWLSVYDPATKHKTTSASRHPNTYEWILKEPVLLQWLDQGSLLWLRGSSGTGKTVAM